MASEQPAAREPDDALDDFLTAVLTASRVLVGVSAQSLMQVEDQVTPTQFRTLVVLASHGQTRLNKLAERLGVNPSTAQRSVDRLIAAGFVARRENDHDRREVVIELTGSGRDVVDQVTRLRRQAITGIVSAIPAGRRRDLVDALVEFAAAADEPLAASDHALSLGW
jgi:DNA-binding MarR family transcriptional regulator